MPYQKGQAAKTEELEGQLSGKGSATKNDNPSAKTGKTDKPDSGVQGGQQAPGTDPKK
ncbi:hypothetical protein KAR91_11770 [Candidatus Pacearchaeota archaeon]|nr:hypothetical protein [Candidatus Pacearchaeota archaeon]